MTTVPPSIAKDAAEHFGRELVPARESVRVEVQRRRGPSMAGAADTVVIGIPALSIAVAEVMEPAAQIHGLAVVDESLGDPVWLPWSPPIGVVREDEARILEIDAGTRRLLEGALTIREEHLKAVPVQIDAVGAPGYRGTQDRATFGVEECLDKPISPFSRSRSLQRSAVS